MSLDRKLPLCAVAVFALLIGSSSAIAKTHAAHTTRISGVVVSINAKRHSLKLRVAHSGNHRKAARAASAGGSTIAVAFADATVKGPDGAVAVGDDITVTTNSSAGQTAVASSIDVIGQPNGGDAGKGAALPGKVTAVDPAAGTLALAIDTTDAQGQSQPGSVLVTVSATTILAVADTNGDGKITLADVSPGDHVVAFTQDATANPVVAVGILDASHSGHQDATTPAGPSPTTPVYDSFNGTVAATTSGGLQVNVAGDGPLAGQTVDVAVNAATHYKGATSDGSAFTFADIQIGDQVRVYTTTLAPQSLLAVFIGDGPPGTSGDSSPSSPSSPPSSPPATGSQTQRFGAVVTAVRGDGLTVTVLSAGPLNGTSVIVSVPPTASFKADPDTGAGSSLATISIGDAVEIYTKSETGSPVVAVGVVDDGVYADS